MRFTFSEGINAASFTTADIVGLTRNGVAVSGVTYSVAAGAGTNNQFDVSFTSQTATGTYALTIGPNIADLAGNNLNQNGNGVNGENPADRYSATGSLSATPTAMTFNAPGSPQTIADMSTVTSTLTVNQDITIAQLSAKLSINHTYDSDVVITLMSPWGTTITLFNRRGGSGDNINTVFDDRATTPIANGAAPFTGWFKPEQALAAFANRNARGAWTLKVSDVAAYDTGKLNSWSITIIPDVTSTTRADALDDASILGPGRYTLHDADMPARFEATPRPARATMAPQESEAPLRFGSVAALPEVSSDEETDELFERGSCSASDVLADWLAE